MTKLREDIRNVAIIAHVDHGKTTLVDELLKQSHTLDERMELDERALDSNDLDHRRGRRLYRAGRKKLCSHCSILITF